MLDKYRRKFGQKQIPLLRKMAFLMANGRLISFQKSPRKHPRTLLGLVNKLAVDPYFLDARR